jgi:hypothetical protein
MLLKRRLPRKDHSIWSLNSIIPNIQLVIWNIVENQWWHGDKLELQIAGESICAHRSLLQRLEQCLKTRLSLEFFGRALKLAGTRRADRDVIGSGYLPNLSIVTTSYEASSSPKLNYQAVRRFLEVITMFRFVRSIYHYIHSLISNVSKANR